MAGTSTALLFVVAIAVVVGVLAAGTALARFEARVARLRQGRRW